MQLNPIAALSTSFLLLFVLFSAVFLIQLYFTVFIHWKLRNYQLPTEEYSGSQPVSVIICARNEQENLQQNLPGILEQDYPDFEVVVVNDCSYDDSERVLTEFSTRYKRLKIVTITEHDRYKHGKKFAVTLGIKASAYELLLFTDADCSVSSSEWIRDMAGNFDETKQIILGYSPYRKTGGFLNSFIRFETFYTALNYLSFALCGNAYMGVGRNLAYKKQLFFKGKGFASHMHILSGDDDLFVNQNATADNTTIEIRESTHTLSEPKTTLGKYITQKLRHYGAGVAYRPEHKRMLTLQVVSGILFYLSAIVLLAVWPGCWMFTLPVILVRMIIQLVAYIPAGRKLKCTELAVWLPILELVFYLYLAVFNIAAIFKKKVQWR